MDLRVLESVQRRWTKRVSGMSGLDYHTRQQDKSSQQDKTTRQDKSTKHNG